MLILSFQFSIFNHQLPIINHLSPFNFHFPAHLAFSIDDQRELMDVEIGVFPFFNELCNRFVGEINGASAFLAYKLHVLARVVDNLVLRGYMSALTLMTANNLRFRADIQRVIDRPDRYSLLLTNRYQLFRQERLMQVAHLLKNHVPHR